MILTIGLLALPAAAILAIAGWLIDRPERPKVRATGTHTRRHLRRAHRAAERAEDDRTIAWLTALRRPPVRALQLARARVTALTTVLAARDREPRCGQCGIPLDTGCAHTQGRLAEWLTAPGPWDTTQTVTPAVPAEIDGRPVETVHLPPLPADLAGMAARYADLFDRHGPHPRPVRVTVVDAPPSHLEELRASLATCPDWEPGIDDTGLRHLAYPWADQTTADFDPAQAGRG